MLSLTDCVEAYEQSLADGVACALDAFLPNQSHPEFAEIVVELVRVEMEHRGWQQSSMIAQYCERFPDVFSDSKCRSIIAFEDFRVRRQHGEKVTPQEYAVKFVIDTAEWPSISADPAVNVVANHPTSGASSTVSGCRRLVPPVTEMDSVTLRQYVVQAFPEFEPVEELGKGAFGRVFLARQRDLADRLVAIKVTSDTTTEPERLARLQHTNIVPVYSVHRTAHWQAICMPFFGRHTLKDFKCDSIHTVLHLITQVAAGLEHAHRNGILHRDIKPANILVTDDGRPMLLDFNLSSDVTATSLTRSIVGGTIPYLAPEQMDSLQTGDAVSATADIYSLGVILFELLAGRLPFEISASASLSALIRESHDRTKADLPLVRTFNPQVSVAVEEIVRKCMHPAPELRYQSAAALAEDLQCELDNRALLHAPNTSTKERFAKWRRRHPRLLSVTSLLMTLAIVLVVTGIRWYMVRDHVKNLQAQALWQDFRQTAPMVRTILSAPDGSARAIDEGVGMAVELLNDYEVLTKAAWTQGSNVARIDSTQQGILDEELSEIVFLLASACERKARIFNDPVQQLALLNEALEWNKISYRFKSAKSSQQAWELQAVGLRIALGTESADVINNLPDLLDQAGELTGFANAMQLLQSGQLDSSLELLRKLVQENPYDYSAWYLLGKVQQTRGRNWEAEAAFSTCIALNSDCWVAWQDRAVARLSLNRFQEAAEDCHQLIQLRPDLAVGYLNLALAQIALEDFVAAESNLDLVIQKDGPTRAYFLRSDVRFRQGKQDAANSDLELGMTTVPNDDDSWVTRGMAFLQEQPEHALADFENALLVNPQCRDALQNSAHVLSERLGKIDEAIDCLDKLLVLYPEDNAARIGRAVLHARATRDESARSDASTVLRHSPDAITHYQIACVYALLSKRTAADADSAIHYFSIAMQVDPQLFSMAEQDSDLDPIRNLIVFQNLLKACQSLLNPAPVVSTADRDSGRLLSLPGK